MKCPQCLTENEATATKCSMCEQALSPSRGKAVRYMSFYAEYFSFRELVTPQLIKVVYFVGACFITAAGLLSILSPDALDEYGVGPIFTRLGGIAALVVGNLVWRLMCEGAILLFSLHELLVSIDTRAGLLVRQGKRIEP
ncbi:MAG: DUF4282 domain-containing protein [Nitrospira sp.]|nr:DUF4282 domain-containing protein [Nitrospira sp.]MDH5193866.1 DUF4282 domain-containing protein [Nitrospira sp.]